MPILYFASRLYRKGTNLDNKEFRVSGIKEYNTSNPVLWILSHLLHYPVLPFIILIATAINNIAYSAIQVYIGKSFDNIVSSSASTGLLLLVLVIIASAAAQGLSGLVRNFGFEFIGQRLERDVREEFYVSLLGKDQAFHGRQRVGDIMARATNDVRTLNLMFNPGLMLITDSLFSFIVPYITSILIFPKLALVPTLFLAVWGVTIIRYNKKLKPVSIKQREQFGELNAGLEEAIEGIEVVKSNAREKHEWNKFTGNAKAFRDYFVKQGLIQAKYWPMLVFAFSWGCALLHALYLYDNGSISIGQVVSFMGLFNTFRYITFMSIFSFNLAQLGMASAERILDTIKNKTHLDENPEGHKARVTGEVVFENVSFRLGEKNILSNISFTVKAGETIAIVGRTGSGKTIMTRLINRIFDPAEGKVFIDGIQTSQWNLESLRSQISTIEQDIFLFSRSVRENISFGALSASEDEIVASAKEAQAHDFIMSFKEGYDTEIGERGTTLSGGQKQRIAIARAFLTDPRILILDDSSSAIDSQTEDKIQKAMRKISSRRTTFLITHRLSQIRWADKICVLDKGKLVDFGPHEELMNRSEEYKRIFSGA